MKGMQLFARIYMSPRAEQDGGQRGDTQINTVGTGAALITLQYETPKGQSGLVP